MGCLVGSVARIRSPFNVSFRETAHCRRKDWGSGILGPSPSPAFKLAVILDQSHHTDPLGLSFSPDKISA